MQGMVATMTGGYGWLLVLVGFMAVSWVARSWANSGSPAPLQYAGLTLVCGCLGNHAAADSVYLHQCAARSQPAGDGRDHHRGRLHVGLTAVAFITRADLSNWGRYLMIGGFVAMGVIVAGILFGFSLGLWFSALMVAFMCAYILYDTSNVIHNFGVDQHVAASLVLFADVVMLFFYVLRILMASHATEPIHARGRFLAIGPCACFKRSYVVLEKHVAYVAAI